MGAGSGKEQKTGGQGGTIQSKWIRMIVYYITFPHKFGSYSLSTNTLIYGSEPHSFSIVPSEKSR